MTEDSTTERILVPMALGAAAVLVIVWNAALAVWLYGLGVRLLAG